MLSFEIRVNNCTGRLLFSFVVHKSIWGNYFLPVSWWQAVLKFRDLNLGGLMLTVACECHKWDILSVFQMLIKICTTKFYNNFNKTTQESTIRFGQWLQVVNPFIRYTCQIYSFSSLDVASLNVSLANCHVSNFLLFKSSFR